MVDPVDVGRVREALARVELLEDELGELDEELQELLGDGIAGSRLFLVLLFGIGLRARLALAGCMTCSRRSAASWALLSPMIRWWCGVVSGLSVRCESRAYM